MSNTASQRAIPADLAGYQQVVMGYVTAGDILIRRPENSKEWAETSVVGSQILGESYVLPHMSRHPIHCAVYRLMPVAKHLTEQDKLDAERRFLGALKQETGRSLAGAGTPPAPKAATYDEEKPPLAWLPWKGLIEVSKVQQYGHKKYKDFNNFRKGMEVSRNLSCAFRHMVYWMCGEDNDKESGCSHLAHAVCRLLFILENIADSKAIDDRYKLLEPPVITKTQ